MYNLDGVEDRFGEEAFETNVFLQVVHVDHLVECVLLQVRVQTSDFETTQTDADVVWHRVCAVLHVILPHLGDAQ